MRKLQVHLDDLNDDRLARASHVWNVSQAEIIRRALDAFFTTNPIRGGSAPEDAGDSSGAIPSTAPSMDDLEAFTSRAPNKKANGSASGANPKAREPEGAPEDEKSRFWEKSWW